MCIVAGIVSTGKVREKDVLMRMVVVVLYRKNRQGATVLKFTMKCNDCRFGLWRDNKFLTAKKINLTKKMVAELLKNGKYPVKGIFSEKTGKSYDAVLVLADDGTKTVYSLDFGKEQPV